MTSPHLNLARALQFFCYRHEDEIAEAYDLMTETEPGSHAITVDSGWNDRGEPTDPAIYVIDIEYRDRAGAKPHRLTNAEALELAAFMKAEDWTGPDALERADFERQPL